MDDNRMKLQTLLEEVLGSKQVYFQPPETIKMSYPAIVFSLEGIRNKKANDSNYLYNYKFNVNFITKSLIDDKTLNTLFALDYCTFDRSYKSDGLYHYVFTIYK